MRFPLARAVSFEVVYPKAMDSPVEKLECGVLPGSLAAQWHRMDLGIQRVRDTVNSPLPYDCPSAVADTLDALYDLWETWSGGQPKLSLLAQNALAEGNVSGETAAALVFARGDKTHKHIMFGELTDTFSDTFHDHYGCWRWQPYPSQEYAPRNKWYATRVSGHEALTPLVDAVTWLREQPELV